LDSPPALLIPLSVPSPQALPAPAALPRPASGPGEIENLAPTFRTAVAKHATAGGIKIALTLSSPPFDDSI
jgi:hypothetical protein